MPRIISGSVWGLAFAAIAAFSSMPASAAYGDNGANSPHILLVHGGGGGGGGGGHGGGGFSGGGGSHSFSGGGFSSGAHSFSGGSSHAFSSASPAFSGGSHSFNTGGHSFNGNMGNFSSGNHSSFSHSSVGHDGYSHGGWNHGNWAWHGHGDSHDHFHDDHFHVGFGFGYPFALWWLGGYGSWYPGYYDYGYGPYSYYDAGYAYPDNGAVTQQSYSPVTQEPSPQGDQTSEEGQGSQYLDEAVQNFQGGNYKNAMRLAEHGVVDSPRDAEAHELISLAAFANKDYRTAAAEAHAVVALGGVPSWDQVYALYQNKDAYTSHLRALEDYVKANPKSPEGQFLLGVQYMTTGYSSDAHDHLTKAAEFAPKDKILQELLKGAASGQPSTSNLPAPDENQ